jgi:phosphate-selective porin OprO/OprP
MIGGLRKTSLYLLAGVSALGVLASGGTAAQAQNTQQLEAQMRAMQAQMRELQRQVNQAKADAAAAKGSNSDSLDLKVKWKGAPELSSADGKFKFKVRGRLMVDYDSINQDRMITGEPDINGWEARRARLGVEGTVWYDWKYKFEVDFAGGNDAEVKDAYIAYAGFGGFHGLEILMGQFKVANSLEGMTSSRFITFMERSAFIEAFELEPRYLGVGVVAGGDHWSFQTSYNGSSIEDQGSFSDDQTVGAVRGTVAPLNNENTVLHLGASYRHRDAGTERDGAVADLYRYRARGADLHLADRFVDTRALGDADDYWGLEGAFVYNRFSAQGEYGSLTTDVPQFYQLMSTTNLNPDYEGWYVEGSVFLTNDMRNYEADKGEFGRVKVKNPVFGGSGGWGAWQIAGRYDVINLGSEASLLDAAGHDCDECGSQETWTIGLNWWMTDYTALKFNVTSSDIGGVFNENDGATIDGFGLRGQVDW